MRLLTWNIQWGRGADGRVDLARTVAQARRFADPDVWLLQEVAAGYPELPGGAADDGFARLAALLPGFEIVCGVGIDTPRPGGGRRRFGNAVASRLPVGAVLRHLLPWPAESGAMSMQRVLLEATVRAPFGALRVLTTHLEYYSAAQRAAQVERLRELHREAVRHAAVPRPGTPADGPFDAVPRAAPAVLAGDFNAPPEAPERARLLAPFEPEDDGSTAPGWRDAWALAHPGQPHAHTLGVHDKEQWPDGPRCFDFFYVSDDLAPRVTRLEVDAAADASDHQPVLLELDDRP